MKPLQDPVLPSLSNPRPEFEDSLSLVVQWESKYGRFRRCALRDVSEVNLVQSQHITISP